MAATGCVSCGALTPPARSLTPADFSNALTKSQIEEMATVDQFEVVKEIQVRATRYDHSDTQEYFADYLAHYPSLFTLTQEALADGGEGPPNVRTTNGSADPSHHCISLLPTMCPHQCSTTTCARSWQCCSRSRSAP